jgi:hypothetical protein
MFESDKANIDAPNLHGAQLKLQASRHVAFEFLVRGI